MPFQASPQKTLHFGILCISVFVFAAVIAWPKEPTNNPRLPQASWHRNHFHSQPPL
jgi:hypothetical protein